MKMTTPFQDKMWFHNTIFLSQVNKKIQKIEKKRNNHGDIVLQQA